MKNLIVSSAKEHKSVPFENLTGLVTQIKPIIAEVPIPKTSYYRWHNQQPKLLFGTMNEDKTVRTRNALMVPLSFINDKKFFTLDDIADDLKKRHFSGLLYATDKNLRNNKLNAELVLPLDKELTQDDQPLYRHMIQLAMENLHNMGILKQASHLQSNPWNSTDPYPVKNQFTQGAMFVIGDTESDADQFRIAAQKKLFKETKPSGMVTDTSVLDQYIATHQPLDIIADFAKYQKSWLIDPQHLRSTLIHLHAAVENGQLAANQAHDAVTALVGKDNASTVAEAIAQYDQMHGKFMEKSGLEFFVQADALTLETPWLKVSDSGAVSLDASKYAVNFYQTHQAVFHLTLPAGVAYYNGQHWQFGMAANKTIHQVIGHDLIDAGVFDTHHLNDCYNGVSVLFDCNHDNDTRFEHPDTNLIEFGDATYNIATDTFSENKAGNYMRRFISRKIKKDQFKNPTLTINWIKELVGQDEQAFTTLIRFIGYAFTTDYPHQVMLFLTGRGGNGKSYFLRYLTKLFDARNVSNIKLEDLTNTDDRFSTARLDGKFLNVCADVSTIHVKAIQQLKTLTGGDRIQVQNKNQTPYDMLVSTKFIFSVNQLPTLNDFTYGFFRRPRVINFPLAFDDPGSADFTRDFQKKYQMKDIEKEADDFIYYCLRQYWDAHQASPADADVFPESSAMIEAKENWINTSDSAGSFIRTYLTLSEEAMNADDGDPAKDIYEFYRKVTEDTGAKPITRKKLVNRLIEFDPRIKQIRAKRRDVQALRIRGVIFNDVAIDEIFNTIGAVNMQWIRSAYGFKKWQDNDNIKPFDPLTDLAEQYYAFIRVYNNTDSINCKQKNLPD